MVGNLCPKNKLNIMNNIFDIPTYKNNTEEIVDLIEKNRIIKIERIISFGQKTPDNVWLCEKNEEWVILLKGKSLIIFENGLKYSLHKGDYISINANTKHRVEYTSKKPPCIWLTIHFLK
jgi:cupin 2 domain-containing protein